MNTDKVFRPYDLPATFRAYVYDAIVLSWETKYVNSIFSTFNNKTLQGDCGLDVQMIDKLPEVQLLDQGIWLESEFLVFYNNNERGYSCLYKRLRDTFAHGHYGSNKRGWITIRHRYKGSHDKVENTRAFGSLKITTLKKLVAFLDTATGVREAA